MSKVIPEDGDESIPIVNANYGTTSSELPVSSVAIDEDEPIELTPLVNIVQEDDTLLSSPVYRDWPWALLFVAQMIVMLWLGTWVAPKGYSEMKFDGNLTATIEVEMRKGDDMTEQDIQQFQEFMTLAASYLQVYPQRILFFFCIPMALLGYVFVVLTTAFLIKPFAKQIVQTCLIFSFVIPAMIMIVGFAVDPSFFGAIFLLGILSAVGYFVRIAWPMIPFAAINLKGALVGMSQNAGVYLVAFLAAEIGLIWPLYWTYVVVGVSTFNHNACVQEHPQADWSLDDHTDECDPPGGAVILFLLSLYWTNTVIMNTVQVSVAGVMATWCFDKQDADKCCSPAVFGSLQRSLTYSFGSICLGSLLQALVSVFRFMVESARNQRDRSEQNSGCGDLCLCIFECIAKLLEDVLEYFNQWAYVFVGIYGFSYMESGKRVMELFRARGWTAIINNHLVSYVLGFTSSVVGVAVGLDAALYEWVLTKSNPSAGVEDGDSFIFGPLPGPRWWAAGIGFLLGVWVSSVAMNVVRGAVNTLVVCMADSPATLQENHPVLAKEIEESWKCVLPEAKVTQPALRAIVV